MLTPAGPALNSEIPPVCGYSGQTWFRSRNWAAPCKWSSWPLETADDSNRYCCLCQDTKSVREAVPVVLCNTHHTQQAPETETSFPSPPAFGSPCAVQPTWPSAAHLPLEHRHAAHRQGRILAWLVIPPADPKQICWHCSNPRTGRALIHPALPSVPPSLSAPPARGEAFVSAVLCGSRT